MDADEGRVIATIKGYHKLCKDPHHRSKVIAEGIFSTFASTLLESSRPRITKHIVLVLLTLTEKEEDCLLLKDCSRLRSAVATASENTSLDIPVMHNLVYISSRLNKAGEKKSLQHRESRKSIAPRRFVQKSLQLTFIVDDIEKEELRMDIEKAVLALKGVISISITPEQKKAVMRVTQALGPQIVVNALYDAGAERVQRLVRNDSGEIETWDVLREEEKMAAPLPDYIEDVEPANPDSCVVVGGQKTGAGGGWMSSISSFISSSLW